MRIVASSHTCLPVARALTVDRRAAAIINNGAAGMPNFSGLLHGVITRISIRPSRTEPLYALRVDDVCVEALAVHYEHDRFLQSFERCWSPDSPAYRSYHRRIVAGPTYTVAQALRCPAPSDLITGDSA